MSDTPVTTRDVSIHIEIESVFILLFYTFGKINVELGKPAFYSNSFRTHSSN